MRIANAGRSIVALLFVAAPMQTVGCTDDGRDPTATETEAITHGSRDTGDPAVARIEGGLSPCTGSLISARVVLTAGHCLEFPVTAVFFGVDASGAGDRVGVLAQVAHPDFDAIRVDNDVALLLLERPVSVPPLAWTGVAPAGSWVDAEVRLVGFGRIAGDDPLQGEKRSGTARIRAAGDTDLLVVGDPSLPCLGDSGGPVLAGDAVIGVVSTGDPGCSEHARAMRMDAYALSFVVPQLAAWGEMSATGAGCATVDRRSDDRWGLFAVAGFIVAVARSGWRRQAPRPRRDNLQVPTG